MGLKILPRSLAIGLMVLLLASCAPAIPLFPSRLAIVDADGRIRVVSSDGGTATVITPSGHNYRRPVWSLDGRLLAFLDEGGSAVFMASAGGEWVREVYRSEDERPVALGWSPDSAYLALTSRSAVANVRLLHTISAQSGNLHTLDAGPDLRWAWQGESDLVVHAGGRRTYMSAVGEVLDEHTGNTPPPPLWKRSDGEESAAVPSPDGQVVARFAQQEGGRFTLSFVNAWTGLEHKRYSVVLTPQYWSQVQEFDLWRESARLWSPGGRYLAVAELSDTGPTVWLYPAAGRLPPQPLAGGSEVSWSWR